MMAVPSCFSHASLRDIEVALIKLSKELELHIHSQLESHRIPMLGEDVFVLSWRFTTLLDEAEADLPFLTRVKAIYKLLVNGMPEIYPNFSFTVATDSWQISTPAARLPLTIDNIVKNAKIETGTEPRQASATSARIALVAVRSALAIT